MAFVRSFSGQSTNASPSVYTMGTAMSAGETVVFVLVPTAGQTISAVTVGGNAATIDLTGNTNHYIVSYSSASGGETSVSMTISAAGIVDVRGVVDDAVDSADKVDTTVAYATSGEGFVTAHQFDITTGVPATGGLVVLLARPSAARVFTGTSGTTAVVGTSTGIEMLYEAGVATGAVALNFTLSSAANVSGMLVSYNYAASSTPILLSSGMWL
jgi:hypothetical protein